jgi:hypothetical protein
MGNGTPREMCPVLSHWCGAVLTAALMVGCYSGQSPEQAGSLPASAIVGAALPSPSGSGVPDAVCAASIASRSRVYIPKHHFFGESEAQVCVTVGSPPDVDLADAALEGNSGVLCRIQLDLASLPGTPEAVLQRAEPLVGGTATFHLPRTGLNDGTYGLRASVVDGQGRKAPIRRGSRPR